MLVVLATSAGWTATLRLSRTDERALRGAHPGAPVVRARLADDASLHLARWAKAVGVELPVQLDEDLLLVATDDGLGLWTSRWPRRHPRPLAVLPWDDVELERREARATRPAGSWALLTLRGPAPSSHARSVPRDRSRHPVSLLLYDGSSPVTGADAVQRTISRLTGGVRPRR